MFSAPLVAALIFLPDPGALPAAKVKAGRDRPVLVPSLAQLLTQKTLRVAVEEKSPRPSATSPDSATQALREGAGLEEVSAEAAAKVAAGSLTGLQQARRVAVYELERQGIEPNIGTVVTDSLLAEVRKLEGISAIGMDEIKDMLSHEANKQILGCEADDSCLAEIAGALGVDDLVTGKLSKVGDNHVMLVRRINQREAKVVAVFNKRLKAGSGQEFLLSIGPAVEELFPDRQVRAGLSRGVPDEVALRLDPPPLPTYAFWSVAGGAAAAAAVGGVFGVLSEISQSAFGALLPAEGETQADPVPGAELMRHYNDARMRADVANVAFGTAGALAIAAGVMFLFTDWEGYASTAQ